MTATPARAVACTGLLAAALAIAACGDDNDDDKGQANAGQQTTAEKAPTGTDEQQIKQFFADIQTAFVKQNGQAYCDGLAQPGQKEVVRFGKTLQLKGDCATVINQLAKNSADLKQVRAKIVVVNIKGNKANATVQDNDRPPVLMRFVKVDGQWKLHSPGFEDALKPQGGRAAN